MLGSFDLRSSTRDGNASFDYLDSGEADRDTELGVYTQVHVVEHTTTEAASPKLSAKLVDLPISGTTSRWTTSC